MSKLKQIKEEYYFGDLCMSELLRSHDELSPEEKQELLEWAGDDDYCAVTSGGMIETVN